MRERIYGERASSDMFLKIGHRGAKAYVLENSLDSFKKAIALDANSIELDLRKTKDKEIIVLHDDNLKRVFGIEGKAAELSLEKIKNLTKGKVPDLKEALEFLSKQKKVLKILIELKEVGFKKKVLDAIKKYKLHDRAIIVSFNEKALSNIRKLDKKIATGLIYAKHKNPLNNALNLKAQYILPFYKFTHTSDVEKAHQKGLKVIVWTVNTKREAEEYAKKGVDGIASDRPDILKNLKVLKAPTALTR